MLKRTSVLSLVALVVFAGCLRAGPLPRKAQPRDYLPPALSWMRNVEAAQMLSAILSGEPPASGNMGWFHPGQSQYSLKWLIERMDKDHDSIVSKEEFTGPVQWFDRLDRDHDGRLTSADFDWSDEATINRQMRIVNAFYGRIDADHDEKLTASEWLKMFEQAAKGKDAIGREELHALLFPLPPAPSKKPGGGMPTPFTLLKGLFEGEIGSFHEGPQIGRLAPDFSLPRHDKDENVTLAHYRGKKPVVLVFGSFT